MCRYISQDEFTPGRACAPTRNAARGLGRHMKLVAAAVVGLCVLAATGDASSTSPAAEPRVQQDDAPVQVSLLVPRRLRLIINYNRVRSA